MPSNLKIKIGDITTAVEYNPGQFEFDTPQAYLPFITGDQPDIHLELHSGFPDLKLGEKLFSSQPIWSFYRKDNESILHIFDQHPDLQRLLVMPPEFKRTELHFAEPDGQFMDPFFGPTFELLMINYLSRKIGVIIHACGIEYLGKGLLFAGESGAGKSTLANLWNQQEAAVVLSDDRTVVREIDGELWMFGTPWHGEAKFGAPHGVKLKNIFFLQHSKTNGVQPVSAANSVRKLLQCSFPTYWDPAGMEYTIELFEKLAACVPCNELSFRPDDSVIEMIKRFMV